MHALWKGAISFGLVNIPVALFSGLKRENDIHFHLLRKSDQSRVRNKRVAEADDEEVPWKEIVKGYEYEKGKYVIMDDDELDEVELKSTRMIDIATFVDLDEIDPVYFSTPYLIQAEAGGEKAYHLLVEVLGSTKTAAIAKIVLRGGRERLVAVLARDQRLVAEVLHFEEDLQPMDVVSAPTAKVLDREKEVARKLVESMKSDWKPGRYKDEYEQALKDLIAKKLSGKKITPTKHAEARPTNVIDLVSILQKSLNRKSSSSSTKKTSAKTTATRAKAHKVHHRKAA